MRNRREQFLKLVCLVFAALLVLHVARLVVAKPFTRLTVPQLPALPFDAQAQKKGDTNSPAIGATNSPGADTTAKAGTNAAGLKDAAKKGDTNSVALNSSTNAPSTNRSGTGTNVTAALATQTNPASAQTNPVVNPSSAPTEKSGTNVEVVTSRKKSKSPKTNGPIEVASLTQGTNKHGTNISTLMGTNAVVSTNGIKSGTNTTASKAAGKKGPSMGGRPGMPGKAAELPAAIKDRVDRIVQGEILGQVIRPMPMALLGIAGESAMLRSPEGQTGLVKEGDTLGTLKLLKIGTNRVVVEVKGEGEPEKKELMMFAGLGSETLLPKEAKEAKESREPKEPKKPDETTKKAP